MKYISNTPEEQNEMLKSIGVKDIEELFSLIPDKILENKVLDINGGFSELELRNKIKELEKKNVSLEEVNSFMGGGAYDHYIPSVIRHITSRSEFYTAYTPYQAELSQGTLQSIYEYQSMICELTGMDIANASLLDGGSALGEAVMMAKRITGKSKMIMSKGIHPVYREIACTYGTPGELKFEYLELDDNYLTQSKNIDKKINDNTAALILQYPNFYGSIEKLKRFKEIIEKSNKNLLLIIICNPITLGVLKSPGKFNADIVVGEGQPLGNSINFGGPYLGYMAIKNERKYLRQMPGRIAGATTDAEGNKGYVLTLQTREQHIRREKATSNICTNEALNALIATIYMSVMGKNGIKEVARQCLEKAHYLSDKINNLSNYTVENKNNFFHEFIVKSRISSEKIIYELKKRDIYPGIDLSRFKEKQGLLICVTEKKTREQLDQFIKALEELE
ncbi:MAG: aminomethyl-transferring glycine dehydrogenase subunit GcvPA [Halanaerobiales bacterium]